MRIGIDARFYGSVGKGLGRYTEKLIAHLDVLNDGNEYVIFLGRDNFDEYTPKNPRFSKVFVSFKWYGFAEQFLFPWVLLRYHLDVMHFTHFNVPFWYPKKFIVTIHDLILLRYPTRRNTTRPIILYTLKFYAYRFVIARAIMRAQHIIAVSRFTADDIISHYPMARDKISITYESADNFCYWCPPVETVPFLASIGLTEDTKNTQKATSHAIIKSYVLYVGNAYPHKNLELLVQTAVLFPNSIFVFVGKEDYFFLQLQQSARQHNVSNVLFTGFVDDKHLSILYRFARCYIFPSFYEGFGLPPLEAMTYGLPVLASNQGSLPEILGDSAYYFSPDQVTSLQSVLTEVLDSVAVRHRLTALGYAQCARYSWQSMAQKTAELYNVST
ncbi:MAG: glycosyltransferase family 4 protein [Minisyncoccota bacterium]